MAKAMTFEMWLMERYALTLKTYKLESEYIQGLLLDRYKDYCDEWEANEDK